MLVKLIESPSHLGLREFRKAGGTSAEGTEGISSMACPNGHPFAALSAPDQRVLEHRPICGGSPARNHDERPPSVGMRNGTT